MEKQQTHVKEKQSGIISEVLCVKSMQTCLANLAGLMTRAEDFGDIFFLLPGPNPNPEPYHTLACKGRELS